MMYSTKEYGFLRHQYKEAEREIAGWITACSPPRSDGVEHSFSHLDKLARELFILKVEMPQTLRERLVTSLSIRINLTAHHEERGDACPSHGFPIEMFGKIAKFLFPIQEVPAVTKLVETAMAGRESSLDQTRYRPSMKRRWPSSSPTAARWMASSWRSEPREDVPRASPLSWRTIPAPVTETPQVST